MPFTLLALSACSLILGVGVDDMFVITDAFERHSQLPESARLAAALREVGPAITLTSVTGRGKKKKRKKKRKRRTRRRR